MSSDYWVSEYTHFRDHTQHLRLVSKLPSLDDEYAIDMGYALDRRFKLGEIDE